MCSESEFGNGYEELFKKLDFEFLFHSCSVAIKWNSKFKGFFQMKRFVLGRMSISSVTCLDLFKIIVDHRDLPRFNTVHFGPPMIRMIKSIRLIRRKNWIFVQIFVLELPDGVVQSEPKFSTLLPQCSRTSGKIWTNSITEFWSYRNNKTCIRKRQRQNIKMFKTIFLWFSAFRTCEKVVLDANAIYCPRRVWKSGKWLVFVCIKISSNH